jgi:TonB family protein
MSLSRILVAIVIFCCVPARSQSSPAGEPDSKSSRQTPDSTPPSAETPQPIRVSAAVSQGLLVHKVDPSYPSKARKKGIQGTVSIRAVIDKEGRISDLRSVSGPEELTEAATKAVKQWRYKPYVLNGTAVEVDTLIRVNFTLENR